MQHVSSPDKDGMMFVINWVPYILVPVLAMQSMPVLVLLLSGILMLTFQLYCNPNPMPTIITFTPIEDQRLQQAALSVTSNSIANVYLSNQQPLGRKSFPIQTQTSYLSCQLASEWPWVGPIRTINHQVLVFFQCHLSSTCMQGTMIPSPTCFMRLQLGVYLQHGILPS